MKTYFGFVYIWYDTKYKKYIIGSHHGSINDGYRTNTGGSRVQRIFNKRPETMKRRILEYNTEIDDWRYTHKLEQKWLNLRPDIATNGRYYNQKPYAQGGFDKSVVRSKPASWRKWRSEYIHKKIENGEWHVTSESMSKIARKRIKEGTHHFTHSDFNKRPFSLYVNGQFYGEYESKVDAISKGIPAGLIDKLRKFGEYTLYKNSRVCKELKAGDKIQYYGKVCT